MTFSPTALGECAEPEETSALLTSVITVAHLCHSNHIRPASSSFGRQRPAGSVSRGGNAAAFLDAGRRPLSPLNSDDRGNNRGATGLRSEPAATFLRHRACLVRPAVGESSVILLAHRSPSLLKRLLKGEGGAAEWQVSRRRR